MVVLQTVLILVRLWEEVSLGSFYSMTLDASPLQVFLNAIPSPRIV